MFQNCYYLSAEENTSVENHTGLTKTAFTSGEAAYKLGDAFGQKIGTDLNPVFRTADNRVLFGEGMYYNEGGAPHEHHYVNGVCEHLRRTAARARAPLRRMDIGRRRQPQPHLPGLRRAGDASPTHGTRAPSPAPRPRRPTAR